MSSQAKISDKHAFEYLICIQKQKLKGREIKYPDFNMQPYFNSIENINLQSQREIFALRTQMNHIPANFGSSSQVKKCDKCNLEMNNQHLFKCTRINIENITYDHILNGNILEQKNALKYINENQN